MMRLIKTPLTGFVVAAAAAVLPTVILARLSAQSPSQSPLPTNPSVELRNAQAAPSEPATRPARFLGGGLGNRIAIALGRPRPGRAAAMSEEERKAAIDFFTQNSPVRMTYFAMLAPNSSQRKMATIKLVEAYRPILNFKESDPDLYNQLVQLVVLHDQAFAEARDGKETDLRATAAKIVPVALNVRDIRLQLLQDELDAQKAKLAEEKANLDVTTQHEVASIKDDEELWTKRYQRQSMLDHNPASDPLAEAAPIVIKPAN
jgi:hypothetical protein